MFQNIRFLILALFAGIVTHGAVRGDDKTPVPFTACTAVANQFEDEVWTKVGVQKCLTCHQAPETDCALHPADRLLKSPTDSCVECHMPSLATIDVQHTSQTDHRVLRNPSSPPPVIPDASLRLASGMEALPEWERMRARGMLMAQFALDLKDPALAILSSETLEPLIARGLNDPLVELRPFLDRGETEGHSPKEQKDKHHRQQQLH